MNKQLSILGNLRVAGAMVIDKDTGEFPTPARLGMFAVKGRSLYVYQDINGFETWYPLFKNDTPAYLHTQAIPSLEWTVNHHLDSSVLWYEVQNSAGDRIYEASREIVDSNTMKLYFTEAIVGTVIVVGPNSVDLSIVNASVLNVGGNVTIDSSGVKVNGQTLLTIANLSTELTPAVNSAVDSALATLAGTANGLATLGSDGKVPASQLPAAVAGGLNFLGTWNASTNNPNIASSIGSTGAFYKVSVAGSTMLDGTAQWEIGDLVLFDGNVWNRIDGGSTEVTSVAGRVGAVVLAQADIAGLTTGSSPTFAAVTAGTFNGSLNGNAATVTKLQTARTIELTGGVTGIGVFDGSGNLAIETTVVGGVSGGGGSTTAPYDVSGSIFGIPSDGEYLARVRACRAFKIPADQSNAQAGSDIAATAPAVFTIYKNSTNVGTITFASGSKVGTVSIAADINFAIGDILKIVCPTTSDASLAYIDISLVGNTI